MNDSVKGILFGLIGYSLVAIMNMIVKSMAEILTPIEITFWRNFLALFVLLGVLAAIGKMHFTLSKQPFAQFLRAAFGTTAFVLSTWAFSILPMVVVTSIAFTAPLIVMMLSWPILKEPVGPWRIGATLMGFLGVLLIADPFSGFQSIPMKGLLICFAFVFFNSLVSTTLRWLGKKEPAMTTVFYFMLIGSLLLVVVSFFDTPKPILERTPFVFGEIYIYFAAALGIFGVASLIFKTQAYVFADATLVTPTSYCMIIWSVIFDWFIWETLPALNVVLGAMIVLSANAIVIWRENQKTV